MRKLRKKVSCNYIFVGLKSKVMQIATYNVNGIRSILNKGFLCWLKSEMPDILCLQELKAEQSQIPTEEFESLGYSHCWFSAEKKGYSGVGILSLEKPRAITCGIGDVFFDSEGRLLCIDTGQLLIVNVYFPNGYKSEERYAYKKRWMETFYDYAYNLLQKHSSVVISGDFNMCYDIKDIHEEALSQRNVKLFLEEERIWMKEFIARGYIDSFRYIHPDAREFTWWSILTKARLRNHGWRMDYHMVSPRLKNKIKNAWIQSDVQYSDHCPVWLELKI